jgi:AraC family transcriptional regulator, melibiose operon regulatory protein
MQIENDIKTDENLQEISTHGKLEYPVGVYYLELAKMHMGMIRWHWHDEIEIDIINSGKAIFHAGDSSFILSAGQAVFINQNILHSIQPYKDMKCTIYTMVFHPSYLFGYGQCYMSAKYLLPVITSNDLKYVILNETIPWQEKLIDLSNSAIAINFTQKYGYELITKSLICQFWAVLINQLLPSTTISDKKSTMSSDEVRVKKAIVFIEAHYFEQLTLDDIASSIHLSKSECCRCFKRSLNLTPFEYLLKCRIYEASKKMKNNDNSTESVSDLASSVGFNNTSYFNKIFKKYLGLTPSEYKKLIINGPYPIYTDLGVSIQRNPN